MRNLESRAVGDGGVQLYLRREHRYRVGPDFGYCQVDRTRVARKPGKSCKV